MTQPANQVRDTFRRRSFGKVEAATNSKSATGNFHVDRARLGTHEEWDPEAKNEWGGTGKYVPRPNDIRLNVIGAMGDLRAKSSNRDLNAPSSDTGTGPNSVPMSFAPYGRNPMYKKRTED